MRRLKLPLVFFSGLLVGSVAAGFYVGNHWQGNFENWYVLGVADQANVAREIASGRAEELAIRVRGSLPQYVLAVEREFGLSETSHWALWMVRDAYEAAGLPIPEEIKPLLEDLIPRGSLTKPSSPI